MPGHRITKGLAWLSVGGSLLAAACEITRLIQMLVRVQTRYYAWVGGYQTLYECEISWLRVTIKLT
jgi:hypothetical protein